MSRKRRRAGRPRADALREPSGRPQRVSETPWTPEQIERRRLLPRVTADQARDQRAGIPLGQLWLAGLVSGRQYRAGEAFGDLHRRWAFAAGARARAITQPGIGGAPEVTAEEWRRLQSEMAACRSAVAGCPAPRLVWSLIDSVIVDEVMPLWLASSDPLSERLRTALTDGLDALAEIFRLPKEVCAESIKN